VCAVNASTGQLPDQPRVDCAEQQVSGCGAVLAVWDGVQQPADLGARKVGIHEQPGALAEERLVAFRLESVADVGGDTALPDHRWPDRGSRACIPDDGCLTLIGDAHASNVGGRNAGAIENLATDGNG